MKFKYGKDFCLLRYQTKRKLCFGAGIIHPEEYASRLVVYILTRFG